MTDSMSSRLGGRASPDLPTTLTNVNVADPSATLELLVEKNRAHMDNADTAAILAILAELGVPAEATEQTTLLKAQWWVLTLHWLGDDLSHLGFDSLLTLLGQRVWRHYRDRGRQGPTRVDVLDVHDDVIATKDIID